MTGGYSLVDVVAAVSVAAITLLEEGETDFGFVGCVGSSVATQLRRAMCELALVTVGTTSLRHVVFAEGTLGLAVVRFVSSLRGKTFRQFEFFGLGIRVGFGWRVFVEGGFAGGEHTCK